MDIIEIKTLPLEPVKVIRFRIYPDHRGYFMEQYRRSDFQDRRRFDFLEGMEFVQCNQSVSRAGTVRGLHFQWNPCQGKLVRTLSGRMIDMVLDIRKGSDTFGCILLVDMPAEPEPDPGWREWIWVPPGFAHGNFFPVQTQIEYFCTGEYNPQCEAGINPRSQDLDWSLCDPDLKELYNRIVSSTDLISTKDDQGFSLKQWSQNKNADRFVFERII
ncbi:MAG: dTDP-4-dehydrorhamnose 3,5-epimerase family protein [Sedimentisphaerales bacterium]|nr:dTDP-4-dehydrorhamnose 3,5-epimerase family protein [Sedimentisphaerales bacterium]